MQPEIIFLVFIGIAVPVVTFGFWLVYKRSISFYLAAIFLIDISILAWLSFFIGRAGSVVNPDMLRKTRLNRPG